jgi:hypothetical protein
MTTLTAEAREATALTAEEYARGIADFVVSQGIDYGTEAFTKAIDDIISAHSSQQGSLAQELETGPEF